MGILFFGIQKVNIGIDEIFAMCPSCDHDTEQEILVTSNYYHFYFIPVFPIEKEITFVCNKCGLRRKDIPMTRSRVKDFDELNRKFKHPWYTYILAIIAGIFVVLGTIL